MSQHAVAPGAESVGVCHICLETTKVAIVWCTNPAQKCATKLCTDCVSSWISKFSAKCTICHTSCVPAHPEAHGAQSELISMLKNIAILVLLCLCLIFFSISWIFGQLLYLTDPELREFLIRNK